VRLALKQFPPDQSPSRKRAHFDCLGAKRRQLRKRRMRCFARGRLQAHFFERIAGRKQARMRSGNGVPGGAGGLHRMIDGRTAFDLLAVDLFDEQFFKELIDERRVDT
jgi:hypothetical protein